MCLTPNAFCMFSAQTLKVNDGPQCTICEFVMTQLDNMLSDNATQVWVFFCFCRPLILFVLISECLLNFISDNNIEKNENALLLKVSTQLWTSC